MKAVYSIPVVSPSVPIAHPQKKRFNPTNFLFACSAFAIFVSSSVTLASSVAKELSTVSQGSESALEHQEASFYPTSIPWLQNRADCEHTGREWSSGKCWDAEHNPSF